MALRAKSLVLLMFVLAASVVLLFLLGPSLLQYLAWDARYGGDLRKHKALVETHLRATHIAEVASQYSPKKWHVCKMYVSSRKPSIYHKIIKFCSVDRVKDKEWITDEERIIAWTDEQGEVVRYIWVCREPKRLREDESKAVDLPMSGEAFQQVVESMGLKTCCWASLLDIENKKYGIQAYHQNSRFYYEIKVNADFWLYWETDYEGNIVARGVHDSP